VSRSGADYTPRADFPRATAKSRRDIVVVRISKGTFDPADLGEAERLLAASEESLREPLQGMPGLIHYYVGIDREHGYLTNVSVWDTLEHAQAMNRLQPMLAQRPILEGAGVAFEVITNHETLWTITP
jgi:hypothetical protein